MRLYSKISGRLGRLLLLASALPILGLAQLTVKDAENPAHSPLRLTGSFTVNAPDAGSGIAFAVPAGKRYVVEFLNVRCTPTGNNIPPLEEVILHIWDATTNTASIVTLVPSKAATGKYHLTNNSRLYADSTTALVLTLSSGMPRWPVRGST